jgi:hypothetical protein
MERTRFEQYLHQLDGMIDEGRALGARLQHDPAASTTIPMIRSWQQTCATTINELSGGSKAHWLARAFSEAFLIRSQAGEAVDEAPLSTIVERVVAVLDSARRSLAHAAQGDTPSTAPAGPHRFDFVHNANLRPVLEQAYVHGRSAFEEGRFADSLMTMCGVLEAIVTDALEFIGRDPREWPFQMRIDAAEKEGLVRGGCARLPAIARSYRDLIDATGQVQSDVTVTAGDARRTTQVLHVVMSELDPGR